MTPGRARKYLMGLALCLLVVNQSGLVSPVSLWGARLAGSPKPSGAQYRMPELMAELKSRAAGPLAAKVALVGEDENFNHTSLNYLSEEMGHAAMKFAVPQPGTLSLADFVVYKTGAFGAVRSGDWAPLAAEISRPWFAKAFSRAASFNLADTSQLVLYAKNPVSGPAFPDGKYPFKKVNLGGILMDEGTLRLSGFNAAGGVYDTAVLFSPYATLDGLDIYGLNIEISGFSCISHTGAVSDIQATGTGIVRIISAKISNYSLQQYLAGKYPGLQNMEVKLDNTVQISGERNGEKVYGELSLSARLPEVYLHLQNLTYAGYNVPDFLLDMFKIKYDLSGLPYDIRFNRIKVAGEMLEIS